MFKQFAISITLLITLIGCGGTSGDTTTNTTSSYTDISVERGPVIGAFVVDNNGKRASNLGNGTYKIL